MFHRGKRDRVSLTVPITSDLVRQYLDLNRERCLLVELLLRLVDVLANAGPQLHLLVVVSEAIVAGPRAIAGHIRVEGKGNQIEQAQKWAPQGAGSGELRTGNWGKLIEDPVMVPASRGDKPKAVGVRRASTKGRAWRHILVMSCLYNT